MFSVKTDWRNRQTKAEQVQKVRCYRCGRERPVNEMVEVGYEVYACPGGCRKAENTEETK